MTGLMYIP